MRVKLVFFVAIISFAVSCTQSESSSKSIRKVKSERVVTSEQSYAMSTYPGKIAAATEVNLSFRVAGVVDKVAVKEGEFVRKDQVVAYLDDRDYKIQLAATQAEYDGIKSEVDRIIALHKENSVSDNDYDKAVNGMRQITSKLEAHKNALEDTKLKAPFDGYIQKRNFDKGEAVSAGMPILSLVSSSAPEVIINITASEYLKRDQLECATAAIDIFADKIFPLKYIGITHKANLNQLHEARFIVSSVDGVTPTPGMTAMVSLSYKNEESNAINIPFSAVVERGGESHVWLIVDSKATIRKIKVSTIESNGIATVTSGLSSGDEVITAGVASLKEGQEVEALSNESESNVGNIL